MVQSGNAAVYFVDRHVKEGRANKVAFREAAGARRAIGYGELADQTGRMAGALAHAGVTPETRAAMLVLDQLEFPVIFWGALKAGVVPIPLNTLLAGPVYEVILKDSRAAVVFVSEELWPVAEDAIKASPYVRQVVVIGERNRRNEAKSS